MTIPRFQKIILDWYGKNRRDLPWRNTKDPYKILVSEIMLQQTQVSRVVRKYHEFLKTFPSIKTLAKAPQKKVLKVWSGLGYWRRALFLHQTAQRLAVSRTYRTFPREPEELEKLPGIGRYTARAIACFAFNGAEAFLDTNIRRVYIHFFFPKRKEVADKEILEVAQKAIDTLRLRQGFGETKEWHYALFDYGAMVLKDKTTNKQSRHYRMQSKFKGSFRSFRSKAVRFLLSRQEPTARKAELKRFLKKEIRASRVPHKPADIIVALVRDGILKESKDTYLL